MPSRKSSADDPSAPRTDAPRPEESDEALVEVVEPAEETDIELLEGFDEAVTE
jgi:hypothetical protein